jgi:hypothetical protein
MTPPLFGASKVTWEDCCTPVPLNGTSRFGVSGSLEFILRLVDFGPTDVGENVTVIV